jgi:hypothetical protein
MGVQGPTGIGISSTECVDFDPPDGSRWEITYTDGSKGYAKGPCKVKLP